VSEQGFPDRVQPFFNSGNEVHFCSHCARSSSIATDQCCESEGHVFIKP
jgi:hypothetical protein